VTLIERIGLFALHRCDPEHAHGLSLLALKAGLVPLPGPVTSPRLRTTFAGLDLANPVGLAAGLEPFLGARRLLLGGRLALVGDGLLEDRVLLQLLLDQLLELGARDLQDLDRLAQLGGDDQLLRHALLLFDLERHDDGCTIG
jgi:hypothetical protein